MILKIHTVDNIILRSLSKSYKFNQHTLPYRYILCYRRKIQFRLTHKLDLWLWKYFTSHLLNFFLTFRSLPKYSLSYRYKYRYLPRFAHIMPIPIVLLLCFLYAKNWIVYCPLISVTSGVFFSSFFFVWLKENAKCFRFMNSSCTRIPHKYKRIKCKSLF